MSVNTSNEGEGQSGHLINRNNKVIKDVVKRVVFKRSTSRC